MSIFLASPISYISYIKVLNYFTKELCCGIIMIRIVLKLSFLIEGLKEIKYILYLAAFIYGYFIGHNLYSYQVPIAESLLGSLILVFGLNLVFTVLFLFLGF